MPTSTGKKPKATLVKQDAIEQTSVFLQSLPEKPKENLSLREAIDQMQDSLREALAKGYNYQELAAMLTEQGIKISAFTLKNYVPSGRRRAAKGQTAKPKTTTRRGSKAKDESADEESVESAAEAVLNELPDKNDVATEDASGKTTKSTRTRSSRTTAAKAKADSDSTVSKSRGGAASKAGKTTTKTTTGRGRRKSTAS